MNSRPGFLLILLILVISLGGCAYNKRIGLDEIENLVVLEQTPFYPQAEYQCGPAALAMVLGGSGITVHPDELTPYTYIPERKGTLQLELLAASRLHGRIPYEIDPKIDAIVAELAEGRPVLVLQNLGLNILPAYHYAVVIGVLPPDKIVLHSGEKERLVDDLGRFIRTWQRTGSWGMVVLRPGELPASPDKIRYLRAVSAFESSGNVELAEQAYRAARTAWPDDEIVLFSLANSYLAQQNYSAAQSTFKEILEINPDNIAAANNLAETYLQQGCYSAARAVIDRAMHSASEGGLAVKEILTQTRDEISKRLVDPEPGTIERCPP